MLAFNFQDLLHPDQLLSTFGTAATIAVILIVFAETGLLVGFFLPGDSLLFLAGLYTVHHTVKAGATPPPHLNIGLLLPGVIIASIVGSQVGYWIGRKAGETLFQKPDSRLFKQEYVERTREFLERYGESKAVFISRFVPVVRPFMNAAVGVVKMPQHAFTIVNIISGVVWAGGVTSLGALIGQSVPNIDRYILPITALIVIGTGFPVYREFMQQRKASKARKNSAS